MWRMPAPVSSTRRRIERCPVCSSEGRSDWLNAAGFRLVQCASCKHKYSTEVLSSECLSQTYYAESVENLEARIHSEKRARFSEYLEMLSKLGCRGGRVLDVGCNAGELLELFAQSGWQVAGVEISAGPAAFARSRLKTNIWQGAVEEVLPDTERFDLVTLTHVLEHLLNPISVLQRLRHALADGVLLLEVPNAHDRLLKAWGGAYRPLCPGDHVSFFSESSLTALLDAVGFDVIEMRSPTHARDLVYPSLLSVADVLRRSATPGATARRAEHGVLSAARYRGRLRAPLRRAVDLLCEKVDPLVVSVFSDSLRTGPVLVATARPRPH